MSSKKNNRKKGATGKQYTTYGDRIKVTYTDGSTRVVRPTDASYASTKKAMEQDIAARKPRTIGSKNTTTAETALGKGVTEGRGLVSSADVEKNAKIATQKRKSQQSSEKAATDKTMKASERAAIINQNAAMNAHKTAQSAAKKAPETIGYAVESGQNQFAGGLQAAPYVVAQDLLTTFKGKNASIDNVKNPLRPNHSLGDTLRAIAARQAQRQNEIQQKYGYDDFSGGQKLAADVGSGIANMAPSLFLATISGGASLAAMGITAAGSAANKALNEGASLQDASTYGIRSGAIEAGTELIGGGIPLLPSVLKGGKVAAKVGGTAGKVLGHAADIGMEGAEEALSEALDPWNQRTSYNPNAQNATAEELAHAALLGSLTSGVLKGVAGGVNLANTARQPKDITPKLVKAGQNVHQEQNNAQNEQQNFQKTQKNQIGNAENAQNGIQQPIKNQTINPITNQNNAPQKETSQADFPQTQQNPKDIRPILKRPTPEPTIPMEQRNFDNVKDKNVLAYQQEHPEVKPYQQAVANQLLADLDMGVKGGRDVGIDPETRNVTQRGGWQRQQSEPVNRMLDAGLSYQKIRKGLNDIVEDNGKENNTTAKRVELYVNDAVVNGYDSITEGRVEQNNAYHYRGMSREQLMAERSRLENNFTGNVETDNAIIRELETIDGLLQQMSGQKAQPVNNDITPELQTAKQAQQQNQQQEPTISDKETVADESQSDSYKDYDVSQLPKDVFDFYNQVGEVGGKANFNIRFVQNLEHDAEGKSDGRGNILISAERANDIETLRRVVAHECYHAMKNTDQWRDIQDLAYKLYKLENPNGTKEQMLQAKIDQYYKRSGGKVQLDEEGAWDEVGAELMGEILSDPKMADRIWNQNPTLAQRITRWLEDMVQKLHDFVFEVEAEDSIYKQAFEAYSEGLQSMRWQGENLLDNNGNMFNLLDTDSSGRKLTADQAEYFKNSKVRDENGNLKVMYHGTSSYGFNVFDYGKVKFGLFGSGFYFTDNESVAESYTEKGKGDNKGIYKVYLNITNPIDMDAPANAEWYDVDLDGEDITEYLEVPEIKQPTNEDYFRALKNYCQDSGMYRYEAEEYIQDTILGMGFDGISHIGGGRYNKKDETRHRVYIAFEQEQIKNIDNQNPTSNPDIRYSFASKKLPNQKYLDQSDENLRNFMEGSVVVNEDGSPKVVYSGHANTNLFGSKFDIKKATSGGFYFTESPEIASSYAEDKLGVMEQYEDGSEYRFYDGKGNPTRRISDVRLTPEQIDIFENKLSDEDDGILGMTYPEYLENVAKYNDQLKWLPRNKYSLTLADIYNIFDQEGLTIHYNKKRSQFEDLLQEFGLEWDSYLQKKQGVFPVYLSIKNPIDTSKPIPLALMGAFEREAAKDRKTYTFDQLDRLRWTADYPMKQWVEDIRRDQENGTAGWSTTIPKKARKIMLEMGYDGIKDTGGKMGGVEHEVWIAFEPNQIKSAIGNRGTFDPTKKDLRYSLGNPQQDNIDKYGAFPPGENPYGNNRDIQVPQQTEDDNRVGRFNRTAAEAQQTDDQTVDILMRELRTYKPSSNQKQMNYANNVIGSVGWERAADSFQTDFRAGKRMTANDVAIGERCIQEAQKAGDYKKAAELIGDVASLGVELGQAVQAMSMLKRLTPEGRLMALKRVQQRINSDLQQKSKKKKNKNDITPNLKRAGEGSNQTQQNAGQVTISPETEQRILEARGQKAMDEAWDAAVQEMADQVDATLLDKVRAWRYLSMLSNPRTHIRNLVGNGVKRGVIGIEHQIQAGIEAAFVKDGGERYRTFKKVPKEYKEFAEWDFETNIRRQMEQTGSRYNDATGQINRNKRIFKPNTLERARKANENALAAEDMFFKKDAYINAFANYMLANNLSPSVLQSNANATSTYKAAQVYAMQKAFEATFQEENDVATFLSQIEHSSKVGEVIIGALMPFKKTPLNILKQGTMVYSPIGLVRGIGNAMTKVRTGEMTQVEAIEQISRGLTGTGIAAVGALMMSLGMIALGGDDDKRKSAYDRQMGDQNYALKFSDGSTYSIDWLSPSVMPLLMGAEIYDTVKRASNGELTDQSIMSAVTSSLMRIGDPLLEMSCMSGFADALSSYSEGGTEALSNIIGTSIKNYAGQFIPAPLGALARTIDDTVRSSYASKDSSIGKGTEQFLRQQRSKIPMVSMQNEASIDVWGDERKREGAGDGIENVAFRAFNNFVNPGNYSSNKRTSLDNELERLYQSTGDSGIFPAVASGTINESQQNPKISMTPLEFSKFSTTKGRKSQQYVSDFVNSESYDQLDDSEKADIISSLYDLANYEARKQTLRNRGYDYSQENYENVLTEITENKITPAEYYSQKALVGDSITGTYAEVKRQMKICDKMGMDYESYHTASTYLNKLRNSTDENGKTIKGNAAKDKKFAALKKWVEEGDVTEEQAWYLWTEEYNSNNRKNDDGYMHWRDCPYQWIIDNKEYEKAMEAEKKKNVE